MNTLIPVLLCAVPFAAPDMPSSDDAGPTRGKVLVLENEQTLTGDIEKVGDQYHVRRLIGETSVPADHVLHLCANMQDAYAFVRGQANLTDPDERLRLAEWCRVNGLHEQAIAEVKAAVELRPDHAPSRRLLSYLQEYIPSAAAAAGHEETAADAPTASIDLTEEALGQFANKVQPILMNACANCHASGHGGAFKLTRTYDSAVLNRKTLQQNLAAVLAEVNRAKPRNSPLLSKAVSVHGPLDQACFRNRQAPAYRTLEAWVESTLADNPQLLDPQTARIAGPTAPSSPSPFAEVRQASFHDQPAPGNGETPPTPPAAQKAPAPTDPYSADAFNRQFHGDKSPNAPPPRP